MVNNGLLQHKRLPFTKSEMNDDENETKISTYTCF